MSIGLKLLEDGICENCPHFEVTTTKDVNRALPSKPLYYYTVSCRNIEKCKDLLKHLQKEENKDGR